MKNYLKKSVGVLVLTLAVGVIPLVPALAQQDDTRQTKRGAAWLELETCLDSAGDSDSAAYGECWQQFGAAQAERWASRGDRGGRWWRNHRRSMRGHHGYAHRGGHHRHRHWAGLVVLVLLIIGGIWLWRRGASGTARQLLDERFARGEIDEAEYLARKKALKK